MSGEKLTFTFATRLHTFHPTFVPSNEIKIFRIWDTIIIRIIL